MRRQAGEGAIYRRPDGLYCGQLDLGWIAGKRRRKTVYGKTSDDVVRKLRTARREMDAGNLNTSSITVEQWLTYWLDEIAAKKVKPRTLNTYRSYVNGRLVPVLGTKKLDKLTPAHVRELHTSMADKSSTSALHAHRILSTALEVARREGRVLRNVATLVDAPRKAAPTRTGLTAEQAKAVLKAAGDSPMASRWWAAFLTGARQGELLGLRWDYVDLDAGVIDLAWSLQRVPYSHGCAAKRPAKGVAWPCGRRYGADCTEARVVIPAGMEHTILDGNICLLRPKTKTSRRVVPLLPAMVAALELHLGRDVGPNPHKLVWHRPDGRPFDSRVDWQAWRDLLAGASVPTVTLHEARNTAATLMLEAGVPPKVISQILGHSNIVTTEGYQRVSLDLARAAVSDLGQRLGLPAAGAAASRSKARKRAPRGGRAAR